jgi:DNA repair protein RadA/Sms
MRTLLAALLLPFALSCSHPEVPAPPAKEAPPVFPRLVAIGEVGLAGEIRRVSGVERRLAEAARLGYTHALVPPEPGLVPDGIIVREAPDLAVALRALRPLQ